jgi:rare lipoprotein A
MGYHASIRRGRVALALVLALAGLGAPAARANSTGGTAAPDASTLAVRAATLLGQSTWVRGELTPGASVLIQRLDLVGWVTVAQVPAGIDGSFAVRWRPDQAGRQLLRAVSSDQASAAQAQAPPSATVTVYRPARATWYGPGFYGKRTACGIRLTRRVVGIAHRSLPCGTLVDVLFHGRTLSLPVIDRGPFAHHASWDLTAAAARQLGMRVTSRIGVLAPAGGSLAPAQPA